MIKTSKKERRQRQREREAWQKPFSIRNDIYKKELKCRATPAEIVFKKLLKQYGIKHVFQKGFYTKDFHCIVDFFIKTSINKIGIEIDGGYHNTPEQKRKDAYRTNWLKVKRNCHVIRFTNEQVISNPLSCLKLIGKYYLSVNRTKESNNHKAFLSIVD